ncbi:MAG: serine protein kinase PrkA [Proteobacteria bacterium]|nr:serine protein kinase PrkA [Pseudomonadota bacterium]
MADIIDQFNKEAGLIRDDYLDQRNVLTFAEYLAEFDKEPKLHLRDSASYLLDAIDHYGFEEIKRPWGVETRYKIFDQEFADPSEQLVGHEDAQAQIRDAVASQVRDGRVNRLLVIHGPNGSAKSTLIKCLFTGLDRYSRKKEGMLYRYRWIFPTRKTSHGTIGFGARLKRDNLESFARLEDDQIDASIECEVRDHPLLLIPLEERKKLMNSALEKAGCEDYQIPSHFLERSLCHRCRQVADALIRTHQGDIRKVFAHVQVERWTMSRRYRRGIVNVGPQMSADASQRQITSDRSLSALPTELQNMTLFETYGSLVDGSGGIVEFEDMLKRPIEAFKYLLSTIETGEVMLGQSILKTNSVLLATTNDDMLEAFRDHHEYPSFRDRLTLIPLPYITQSTTESRIYELQLIPNVDRHVAPHTVNAAAFWAVLSRLHKPNSAAYSEELKPIVTKLIAVEKADLYENGTIPDRLSSDEAALLHESIADMRIEDATSWSYEGRYGASPRLIRQVLLKASLSQKYACLSPFAVLEDLDELCDQAREHPFLEREVEDGGYHDFKAFVGFAEERVLDAIEADVRSSSGLVEESRYLELMNKYIKHVSHVVKNEKVLSETTGDYEDPDESMMKSVEEKLGNTGSAEDFRKEFINRIAAWAIENPGQKLEVTEVFPKYLRRLKDAYFEAHRQNVAKIARYALEILTDEERGKRLDEEERQAGENMIEKLLKDYGYCRKCAKDGVARLFSQRFDA